MAQPHCLRLRFQGKFRRQETMRLGHGRLGAVQNVVNQRRAIGQRLLAAIQVSRLVLIHQELSLAEQLRAAVLMSALARADANPI